jgi:uncharacterized RDD family membrane protein YckC
MTCQYCRAQIDNDAHRCSRCGRKTMDRIPVQMTAAVPELETMEMPAPAPVPLRPQLVTEPPPKRNDATASQSAFQANLFGPIEAQRPNINQAPPATKKSVRPRRDPSRQQTFDFPETRSLPSATASVYCGAPVAIVSHRMMAAGVDGFLSLVAMGVFLTTFKLAGAEIILAKETLPFYGMSAALILLFYRVLFCIANADTPGLRWTGLRVLDFDGRAPSCKQRWYRLLGGFVGAIAAGIGLIWAMVDEEQLTWHDHMSKTFPTPRFY